jgi:hypothetical protein
MGEIFSVLHLFYYVLPCLKEQKLESVYSLSEQTRALLAVLVFLGAFQAAYGFIVLKRRNWTPPLATLLRREVAPGAIWALFGLWLVWCILLQGGLLADTGNALNIFRSVAVSSGGVAALYFSVQLGRRSISKLKSRLFIGGLTFGLILSFAAGYLNGPVQWLEAAILGFVMGRKQFPVVAIVFCLTLLTLLQLGKSEYRGETWGTRQNYASRSVGVVKGYTIWLEAGWNNLWRDDSIGGARQAGLTERANLLPVLATAIKSIPDEKPFLAGRTYAMLPALMVPRIFWPGKPRGTAPTEAVGIYLGITTPEATNYSSIAIGPIAEAWVNFGWIGLVLAGAFFGVLFGLPAQLTKALIPSQVGWLLAAIFLVSSANLEQSTAGTICAIFTALFAGAIVLRIMSQDDGSEVGGKRA